MNDTRTSDNITLRLNTKEQAVLSHAILAAVNKSYYRNSPVSVLCSDTLNKLKSDTDIFIFTKNDIDCIRFACTEYAKENLSDEDRIINQAIYATADWKASVYKKPYPVFCDIHTIQKGDNSDE